VYELDVAIGCQGRREFSHRRLYDSYLDSLAEPLRFGDFAEADGSSWDESVGILGGGHARGLAGSSAEYDLEKMNLKMFKSFLLLAVSVSTTVVSTYLVGYVPRRVATS
jgi:hypothetical protein